MSFEEQTDNLYGFPFDPNPTKTRRTKRGDNDDKHFTEHERVFYRVAVYGGSTVREAKEQYIYDIQNKCFISKVIDTPDALVRLFLEILSNATDNVHNSRTFGVEPGMIEISINGKWISIKNYGERIPVIVKPEISTIDKPLTKIDFIFGTFGTGTNLDDDVIRTSIGVNGVGSKLVNVHSRYFEVKVGDPVNGVEQISTWTHNMKNHQRSVTTPKYVYNNGNWVVNGPKYTGPAYVEVMWKVDFRQFKYPEDRYDMDTISLFYKYALDASFTCKVPVKINGILYDVRNINNYINMYYPNGEKRLIHYEWKNEPVKGIPIKKLEELISNPTSLDHIPVLEIAIVDTPYKGKNISFVNGLVSSGGGCHVDSVKDILYDFIKKTINAKDDDVKFTAVDIKKHITIFVSCRVDDPTFDSQSKNILKSPKIKPCKFSDKQFNDIKKFDMMKIINETIELKQREKLKKTDGKKTKHVNVDNFEGANNAGGKNALNCTLFITEGKSASTYIAKFILGKEGKKDIYGYFSIRGKLLNVRDCPISQLIENKEIVNIKKILGLQEGVDYTTPKGIDSLNYGMVCIAADADVDGQHINALIINFFHCMYPTFLSSGRVCLLSTPVIRIIKQSKTLKRFYSMEEFDEWKANTKDKNFQVKYYKGLGTADDKDIIEDVSNSVSLICVFDEKADESLNIAFKNNLSDLRKQWIQQWRTITGIKNITFETTNSLFKMIRISDFINTKLVEYSIDTYIRALPSYRDGLKKSQRQILYYILDAWNYGKKNKASVKVQRLASDAGGFCHYHHGDDSLSKTLIKMAQDYTGSNNMNFLKKEGQFGTRNGSHEGIGLDSAAGRYIETSPEWWIKYVYHKELVSIVPRVIVEDEDAEPVWIPCDIPVHLINGCVGIATAYSVDIPNHNVIDVISVILAFIDNQIPNKLIPWYKGFTGDLSIEIKNKNKKEKEFLEDGETDEVLNLSLKTEGTYEILSQKTFYVDKMIDGEMKNIKETISNIRITELPIRVGIFKYRKWLESLINTGKIITIDDKMVDSDKPDLYITGWQGLVNKKELKLIKYNGISNISLINDDAIPMVLKSCDQAIKLYYESMKELYIKYHTMKLQEINKQLIFENNFLRLIGLINEDKIIISKVSYDAIQKSLAENNIPLECYEKIKVSHLSNEGYEKQRNKINELEIEYNLLINKNALDFWKDNLLTFRSELVKRKEFIKLEKYNTIHTTEELEEI